MRPLSASRHRAEATNAFGPPRRRWTSATAHVSGLAVAGLGGGTIISGVVGITYRDRQAHTLLVCGIVAVAVGGTLWWATVPPARISRLQAFFTVSMAWVILGAVAAVPFLLAGTFDSVVNAWFESVSGLTTAGSTVLDDIEAQGKGVLFYRQFIQFYGGGGVALLAVAIIQTLGVGGLELSEAEAAGPTEQGRIAPRVVTVARRLWMIYTAMVLLVATALLVAGVGPYDAIAHAMTAVPTAGFSTFNDSIAHFDSAVVEAILIVGMFLGATNLSLHYHATRKGPLAYFRSADFRFFLTLFLGAITVVTLVNVGDGMGVTTSMRDSAFNVTTLMTTCGFGTSDFTTWVPAAQIVLMATMFMGGMAGSTAGGVKSIRLRVMMGHAWREVKRVRHPRGVFVIRVGRGPVAESTVSSIVAFAMIYFLAVALGTIVIAFTGADLITSLGGVLGTLGGVGPGFGDAGPHSNFLVYSEPARVVLSFLMLLGRMEILALLLAFAVPFRKLRAAVPNRRR